MFIIIPDPLRGGKSGLSEPSIGLIKRVQSHPGGITLKRLVGEAEISLGLNGAQTKGTVSRLAKDQIGYLSIEWLSEKESVVSITPLGEKFLSALKGSRNGGNGFGSKPPGASPEISADGLVLSPPKGDDEWVRLFLRVIRAYLRNRGSKSLELVEVVVAARNRAKDFDFGLSKIGDEDIRKNFLRLVSAGRFQGALFEREGEYELSTM
ncbi:MAG: hypothetical protein WC385_00515 [Candidatus Paceibacterota bacterium]|jgi:hypothetical protein